MYCAQSSKWGLFGRNTRSAIRGTSSLKKSAFLWKSTAWDAGRINKEMHLQKQMLRHKAQYGCAVSCFGSRDMLKNAKRTQERFCSMYCAHSSEWGLFGRNTRSAFRRTPSPPTRERPLKKDYLKRNRRNAHWREDRTYARREPTWKDGSLCIFTCWEQFSHYSFFVVPSFVDTIHSYLRAIERFVARLELLQPLLWVLLHHTGEMWSD